MWNHIKIVRLFKSLLPLSLKLLVIRIFVYLQSFFYFYLSPKYLAFQKTHKPIIFVLLSTDYSNLGDHAMTYAHIQFLKKHFSSYEICEIVVNDTLKYFKWISKNIRSDDIITLKGGGNIGIEYFREELLRRKIISTFKQNKIILFPQTVYFPDNRTGHRQFERTVKIFNSHNDFYKFFRDNISYDLMSKVLRTNVFLVPDIVLSLPAFAEPLERKGIVVCMRNDVEGIYNSETQKKLQCFLSENFGDITITDTAKDYYISVENRYNELKALWDTFLSAEIVITDRLHGMIFAALTRTPCIVFKTYNHKLTGQYEWIKHLNYIVNIDFDFDLISKSILKLRTINKDEFDPSYYENYYNTIVDCIKSGGSQAND